MRAIFISYRREDAEGQAGRLFDDLTKQFGENAVFMDVAGITAGRDFRRAIEEQVASCGVLLAMIGKNWIDAKDESGRRRLEDPTDFVRLETASALKRDIPVVPVLVQGARMPRKEQLPEDLAELVYRNGVELTHARWDSDVQVLIKALSRQMESETKKPRPTEPRPKRFWLMVGAGLVVAIVVAIGGYAWYQASSQRAEEARLAEEKGKQDELAERQRLAEEKRRQDELAERRRLAEEKRKQNELAERQRLAALQEEARRKEAAVKEAEARRRAAAAAQRARWPSYKFPPPNGGLVVFTIMPDGNPACASYDGARCLWGLTYDQIDFRRLRPLVCGEAHRARWGVTGYEDPKHWCSLARRVRGNPS